MSNVTRYCGFMVVGIEWVSFFACILLSSPNWTEPASQFGYYDTTRPVFGLSWTLAAVFFYLFARQLDTYWKSTSLLVLLAGIALTVTVWVPYAPHAKSFIFDVHNVAVMLAAVLYSLPMLFISFKKVHLKAARISHILFIITTAMIAISLIARAADIGVIYAQILAITPLHLWLIMMNVLVLKSQPANTQNHRL